MKTIIRNEIPNDYRAVEHVACGSKSKGQAEESDSILQGQCAVGGTVTAYRTNQSQALVLWPLDLAEETALFLAEKYPEARRPREAVEAAVSWARGELKMPIAKHAILNCHAMAKELENPADISRCHAVGQACSVVHTEGHALGYPMYELTAIVLEQGLDGCRDAAQKRAAYYVQRLQYWAEDEKTCRRNRAGFLQK